MEIKLPVMERDLDLVFSYLYRQIRDIEFNNKLFARDCYARANNADFKIIEGNNKNIADVDNALSILKVVLADRGYKERNSKQTLALNKAVSYFIDKAKFADAKSANIDKSELQFTKSLLCIVKSFSDYNKSLVSGDNNPQFKQMVGRTYIGRYSEQKIKLVKMCSRFETAKAQTKALSSYKESVAREKGDNTK